MEDRQEFLETYIPVDHKIKKSSSDFDDCGMHSQTIIVARICELLTGSWRQ